jgi:hypothetical protein
MFILASFAVRIAQVWGEAWGHLTSSRSLVTPTGESCVTVQGVARHVCLFSFFVALWAGPQVLHCPFSFPGNWGTILVGRGALLTITPRTRILRASYWTGSTRYRS